MNEKDEVHEGTMAFLNNTHNTYIYIYIDMIIYILKKHDFPSNN